jgi:uncharacterized membrane protein
VDVVGSVVVAAGDVVVVVGSVVVAVPPVLVDDAALDAPDPAAGRPGSLTLMYLAPPELWSASTAITATHFASSLLEEPK